MGKDFSSLNISLSINRWDVYKHLRALCTPGSGFRIINAESEDDLENLLIGDTQIFKKTGRLAGAVIGTVRLLPMGNKSHVIFLNDDVGWHLPIPDSGESHFKEFIERARNHFDELGVIINRDDLLESSTQNNLNTPKQNNQEKGIWSSTKPKLIQLRKMRRDEIIKTNRIPNKIGLCHQVPIDPKTVMRHDPELWENWENKEY